MSDQQEHTQSQSTETPDTAPNELTVQDAKADPIADGGEAPEPENAPAEDRVFGMPRTCFHGGALGIAAGYILSGIIGQVTGKAPSAFTIAIVCAVIGYLIAKRIYNKNKAEKQTK